MKMKTNKGFTLAELLIVMAIIVVLAAIAIPTFAKQLETARESSDVENIRAAAANAFSESYTHYVTDDQVAASVKYYSTIYTVKFNQHEANFQYMTPMIEIGTSKEHSPGVTGLVTVTNTPASLTLPGDGYLQFEFTVGPNGEFYLTDIYASAAEPGSGAPTSAAQGTAAFSGFVSICGTKGGTIGGSGSGSGSGTGAGTGTGTGG